MGLKKLFQNADERRCEIGRVGVLSHMCRQEVFFSLRFSYEHNYDLCNFFFDGGLQQNPLLVLVNLLLVLSPESSFLKRTMSMIQKIRAYCQ